MITQIPMIADERLLGMLQWSPVLVLFYPRLEEVSFLLLAFSILAKYLSRNRLNNCSEIARFANFSSRVFNRC